MQADSIPPVRKFIYFQESKPVKNTKMPGVPFTNMA